jgi:sialate O-acetylesterase
MKITKCLPWLAAVCLACSHASADVELPSIFSDHMVLLRADKVPVWGWAAPGEEVRVTFRGISAEAKAGADGKWATSLRGIDKLPQGPAEPMAVEGKNRIEILDVLVGEVWLGSGQSNMAMKVNGVNNYDAEQAAADLPMIRMFLEESTFSDTPLEKPVGKWFVCSPETVGTFSATAFFFGRELHKRLGVPVGLVVSAVGGTAIESWTSPEAQKKSAELAPFADVVAKLKAEMTNPETMARYEQQLANWKAAAEKARAEGGRPPRKPRDPKELAEKRFNAGGLFNGKIASLIPYAIRGVIWYQGENNAMPEKAPYYRHQLPVLIADWRGRWGSELPFAWVQLAGFSGEGKNWPTIREAMLQSLSVPKTGMAVTIDIGEEKNIHPKNKQDVGFRLAQWALGTVYAEKVPATSGPLPAGHEVRGKEIVVRFEHADGGLAFKGGEPKGFAVAGEDRKWVPATARIEGETLAISSPGVPRPVAARYAWANFIECNFTNGAGLPASPFRTDDWPIDMPATPSANAPTEQE